MYINIITMLLYFYVYYFLCFRKNHGEVQGERSRRDAEVRLSRETRATCDDRSAVLAAITVFRFARGMHAGLTGGLRQ